MKNLLSFLFVIGFTFLAFAQKTISGTITDSNDKTLPSASVTIVENGKNTIIAYGITNNEGKYKITFTTTEENLTIKVKAYNQKTMAQSIKNSDQTKNFTMDIEATEIQEVKVKTKAISKKGDTISYDLKPFENKADRTLIDVLKKMPGIDVTKYGVILYQGKRINKFYVNGRDITEGNYSTINNLLSKEAVFKVEVLESHQPVKILQDKASSQDAALNIILKKSVTMTGRGELGAGFNPFLWNVKLTPMFFGQKNQWVVNYKANNIGESIEKEGEMLSFGNRWEGRRVQVSQKSWTRIEQSGKPFIEEEKYLLNNVHFFSANLLTSPFKDKEWELKALVTYTNNSITRKDHKVRVYDVGSPFITEGGTFISGTRNNFYVNAAKGELIFTKNTKKVFFKNITSWNSFWNTDKANVIKVPTYFLGTMKASDQYRDSPTGTFQNSLSTILPWKEKLFNVMSYIKYQKDRQKLIVNSRSYLLDLGLYGYDKISQYVNATTLEVNHSASVGFSYTKWTITPEVGLNLKYNNMKSILKSETNNTNHYLGIDMQNDINWNEIQPYTQLMLNYKSQNFNFNLNTPMRFYSITYRDNIRNNYNETNKTVFFEPNMFASLDFASFFKIWAFAEQSYDFESFGFLHGGKMLVRPTSIDLRYDKDIQMPEYLNRNIRGKLEYRNPQNNLFFNVRYSFSTNKKNLIESYKTNGFASQLTLKPLEFTAHSQSEGVEIGKYFPKLKSNISINGSDDNSNLFSYYGKLDESKSSTQTLGATFNNAYFSWISVDYSINFRWEKYTNIYSNREESEWDHNLSTYIYPSKNHTFRFNWDNMTIYMDEDVRRNSFYDVSYQYTWVKKKIDFEFKWINITNREFYEDVDIDPEESLTTINQKYMRPSQCTFTVKFNF